MCSTIAFDLYQTIRSYCDSGPMEFLGAKSCTGTHSETSAEARRERASGGERKAPKTTGFTYGCV